MLLLNRWICRGAKALTLWPVVVLLAATPSFGQTLVDETLSVDTVATGLSEPTTMAFLGTDDILVLEKASGQVRRVRNDILENDPVLVLPVNSLVERGLLGIAINSANPPAVFLYYTEASPVDGSAVANRIVRYTWNSGDAALELPVPLLELPIGPGFHVGGVLTLGPISAGELLYVVIGDTDRFGQLQNQVGGPEPDDTGVILRLQQDGSPAPSNPFAPYCSVTTSTLCDADTDCPTGERCVAEVASYYAYGVRNSFGLALDPVTGHLWDTENGAQGFDEVNRVAQGMNSGWRVLMGPDARNPGVGPGDLFDMPGLGSTYRDPEFTWIPRTAPTGIVFPHNSTLGAAWYGTVLVAGWQDSGGANRIYRLPLDTTRQGLDLSGMPGLDDGVADSDAEAALATFGTDFGQITDLERGPDGHIYVVSYDRGTIYRIRGLPEPASAVALLVGSGSLLAMRRRTRRN